ncbi:DUF202 domain-containing protein [Blautia sp. 2744]|jgi:uncharacterized membrane protein YcjF (UPF0283 family)|uniref:Uncharacterized protein n=3 Tax=Blautia TaxID=572511 RepID=D4LWB2_9FIRM|nr:MULTISPECIES: DUF308 domain-containing protein [Blautia]MBC5741825.1 DUF202 domain-containing protein [Blautia intestinalis]RHA46092.1 DUF202 domain-containing protein [Blautia obeum]RHD29382.1 DUF202 domain-containing protein [Blautia obeum]RHE37190.1 DUF202 domain-containing protein [Blautia obeum]CBL21915.1 hypothetical protein CK5_02920 [Blautia obeum A2-162]
MSEQDKMTEQETEVTTSGEAPQEKKKQEVPTRSMILMILAGCYLLYTGYRLCKNVLDGVEGGSWGFFAAGAAFIVVGAVMLFVGGRNYLRREKEKHAEQEAQAQIIRKTQPAEEKKTMSIADRARLAGGLDDSEETETQADTEKEE